jgi:hypothetical protein
MVLLNLRLRPNFKHVHPASYKLYAPSAAVTFLTLRPLSLTG